MRTAIGVRFLVGKGLPSFDERLIVGEPVFACINIELKLTCQWKMHNHSILLRVLFSYIS